MHILYVHMALKMLKMCCWDFYFWVTPIDSHLEIGNDIKQNVYPVLKWLYNTINWFNQVLVKILMPPRRIKSFSQTSAVQWDSTHIGIPGIYVMISTTYRREVCMALGCTVGDCMYIAYAYIQNTHNQHSCVTPFKYSIHIIAAITLFQLEVKFLCCLTHHTVVVIMPPT